MRFMGFSWVLSGRSLQATVGGQITSEPALDHGMAKADEAVVEVDPGFRRDTPGR
jgi:hypothetical protein